ncbi:hypothetical protein [Ureaplasma zalophigenitalium]|uniref:Uncharacterized protein n=1 Tax=Ureaplasma zalophigenitalium TaxID=907723 RepID=A0ABT3BPN2_9BACT|nr:hypothetical protein [Ureaplasma zalophigenitalium]MCV3754209.1 hypothetical protein [Ureaplasma zalophigenitalium]
MINKRDVITLFIPFPCINSQLAKKSHMYICLYKKINKKEMLKVQTAKPLLINTLANYCLVYPDLQHNPFKKVSLVDLDKVFSIHYVKIPRILCTTIRSNISVSLYEHLKSKLTLHPYKQYVLDPLVIILCNHALMVINH